MQDARRVFVIEIALYQSSSHLYADIEHGLSHLYMLPLQKCLGIGRKIQYDQRLLILRTAQGDTPIGQFNDFQEGCRHRFSSPLKAGIVTADQGTP